MKLHIVHIIIGLSVGGAEILLKRLVTYHSEDPRFLHTVISLTTVGEIGEEIRSSGVTVHELGLCSIYSFFPAFLNLIKLLKKNNPEIIQTWMYHAELMGSLAGICIGHKRIMWTVLNTDIRKGTSKITYLIAKINSFLSKGIPEKIIFVAKSALDWHCKFGYYKGNMSVIHSGFELNEYRHNKKARKDIRKHCLMPPNALIIGSVGRYNEYKDHNNFVKAAEIIAMKFSNSYFLMIGEGVDKDNKELMDVINNTGYRERFILPGGRPYLPDWMSTMDVFALHSISEGFPNVLGEAMAAGLPCVTTNVGDARIMIGLDKFVVPPKKPYLLAEALSFILELDVGERSDIGEMNRNRIIKKFHISQFINLYEHLYLAD